MQDNAVKSCICYTIVVPLYSNPDKTQILKIKDIKI